MLVPQCQYMLKPTLTSENSVPSLILLALLFVGHSLTYFIQSVFVHLELPPPMLKNSFCRVERQKLTALFEAKFQALIRDGGESRGGLNGQQEMALMTVAEKRSVGC